MQTQTAANEDAPRRTRGRKDNDGIEKTIDVTDLPKRIKTLEALLIKANEAANDYKEAVKKTAEKCGLQASVINKGVKAVVKVKTAESKRDAEQLVLVLETVGE